MLLLKQLKLHHEQSKTIGLKNDLIEQIVEVQKKFLTQQIEEETKTIFDSSTNPEAFQRYKISVEMLADLIGRGAEIKPAVIKDEEVKKSFPDFKNVNLLEQFIKTIGDKP